MLASVAGVPLLADPSQAAEAHGLDVPPGAASGAAGPVALPATTTVATAAVATTAAALATRRGEPRSAFVLSIIPSPLWPGSGCAGKVHLAGW
jgi:hypothetical protein